MFSTTFFLSITIYLTFATLSLGYGTQRFVWRSMELSKRASALWASSAWSQFHLRYRATGGRQAKGERCPNHTSVLLVTSAALPHVWTRHLRQLHRVDVCVPAEPTDQGQGGESGSTENVYLYCAEDPISGCTLPTEWTIKVRLVEFFSVYNVQFPRTTSCFGPSSLSSFSNFSVLESSLRKPFFAMEESLLRWRTLGLLSLVSDGARTLGLHEKCTSLFSLTLRSCDQHSWLTTAHHVLEWRDVNFFHHCLSVVDRRIKANVGQPFLYP